MIDDESLEDMMLAGLVISNRLWRLAVGHPTASQESQRMVEEKLKAATDGYFALTKGLVSGDPESWQNPGKTFVKPGRKTLRKNAKRLAGYSG